MTRVWVERVCVILLISLTLVVSLSQTILYAWKTPLGTVYPLVHNFVEDYYQYLDIMRQGWDGWWAATSRMTPEVYPRVFVSVFLLFLGHVARITGMTLPAAYTGARLLGGAVLMALVYQLIRRTYPQSLVQRLIAFCFVLFGTYFWGWSSGGPTVSSLTHAWTELDPIFRWSFVPHHLWSKVGMLAVFLLLFRPRKALGYMILLAVTVLLTGMTNPVVYATMVPTVGLWFLFELVRDKARRTLVWHYVPWIVVGAVSGAVLLYHRYLQTHVFPWTSYLVWEQTLAYAVNPLAYAQSLGPALILFLVAVPTLFKTPIGRLLIAWAASSWVMLYVLSPFVPVTPERYLGGYQFIPLGIGAATAVFLVKSRLIRLGLVAVLLTYFAIGLWTSFTEHAGYVAANRTNTQIYVPHELMAMFTSISGYSKPEDVVMASFSISTMIPGFTGRRVMAGHAMFTRDVTAKKALINAFFGTHDPVVAEHILSAYGVGWVLADAAWIPLQDIHLVRRFGNGSYTLYSRQ